MSKINQSKKNLNSSKFDEQKKQLEMKRLTRISVLLNYYADLEDDLDSIDAVHILIMQAIKDTLEGRHQYPKENAGTKEAVAASDYLFGYAEFVLDNARNRMVYIDRALDELRELEKDFPVKSKFPYTEILPKEAEI